MRRLRTPLGEESCMLPGIAATRRQEPSSGLSAAATGAEAATADRRKLTSILRIRDFPFERSKKEATAWRSAQSLLKGLCQPRSGEVGGQAFRRTPAREKADKSFRREKWHPARLEPLLYTMARHAGPVPPASTEFFLT
jgi:hypothetical protein